MIRFPVLWEITPPPSQKPDFVDILEHFHSWNTIEVQAGLPMTDNWLFLLLHEF